MRNAEPFNLKITAEILHIITGGDILRQTGAQLFDSHVESYFLQYSF